jgi:hypothetical protein
LRQLNSKDASLIVTTIMRQYTYNPTIIYKIISRKLNRDIANEVYRFLQWVFQDTSSRGFTLQTLQQRWIEFLQYQESSYKRRGRKCF